MTQTAATTTHTVVSIALKETESVNPVYAVTLKAADTNIVVDVPSSKVAGLSIGSVVELDPQTLEIKFKKPKTTGHNSCNLVERPVQL